MEKGNLQTEMIMGIRYENYNILKIFMQCLTIILMMYV